MTKAKDDGLRTGAKRKPTKAVAKVEQVPGRLINKVAIEDGVLAIYGDDASQVATRRALATESRDFVGYSIIQLSNLFAVGGKEDMTLEMNAAVAMLEGIAPRNELEAMLAAQMVATHHLSMNLAQRTITAEGVLQYQAHGNLATKFARTFTAQMEALGKLRRGGEQLIRHVHVNEGGQALIAGTVHTGGSGNG